MEHDYYYLKKGVRLIKLKKALSPELYSNIGSTLQDYRNGSYIPLNDIQASFAVDNPNATIEEILDCQLTPVPVRSLAQAKAEMLTRIDAYDVSPAVNSFMLNGDTVWIDNFKRISITDSATKEKAMGRTVTTFWLDGRRYDLPIDIALQMLTALEVYAKDCYNVTASHKYSVSQLSTIEEVDAYDYRIGYPERLNLDGI